MFHFKKKKVEQPKEIDNSHKKIFEILNNVQHSLIQIDGKYNSSINVELWNKTIDEVIDYFQDIIDHDGKKIVWKMIWKGLYNKDTLYDQLDNPDIEKMVELENGDLVLTYYHWRDDKNLKVKRADKIRYTVRFKANQWQIVENYGNVVKYTLTNEDKYEVKSLINTYNVIKESIKYDIKKKEEQYAVA